MTIWLYSIIRNEAPILPYFIRHYEPWVERMIFYDCNSDDGTREIIKACPAAELREWEGSDALVDDEFLEYANTKWKEARGIADWVIWVDADEFLYHPRIRLLLWEYYKAGVTVPRIDGYTMVSDRFPTTTGQIYDEISTGFSDMVWGKPAIFQPHIEMRYNVGRHSLNADGFTPVYSAKAEIKLLHYRALGMEYLKARHARNWNRVPAHCRCRSYGVNCEPEHDGHHGIKWFEEMMAVKWENVI